MLVVVGLIMGGGLIIYSIGYFAIQSERNRVDEDVIFIRQEGCAVAKQSGLVVMQDGAQCRLSGRADIYHDGTVVGLSQRSPGGDRRSLRLPIGQLIGIGSR